MTIAEYVSKLLLMLTRLLLKIIEEIDIATTEAIFGSYCLTYRGMWNAIHRPGWKSKSRLAMERKIKVYEEKRLLEQRFYRMLAHLHRQGLIEKKEHGKFGIVWRNTAKGKEKLRKLIGLRPLRPIGDLEKDYFKVVVFDIPEKEKRKRNWLRQTLHNLEFSMLQKSVWVGDNKLPEELFTHLRSMKILPCVHIFAVEKKGTINFDFQQS